MQSDCRVCVFNRHTTQPLKNTREESSNGSQTVFSTVPHCGRDTNMVCGGRVVGTYTCSSNAPGHPEELEAC